MFAPLERLQSLKGFNPNPPTMPKLSFNLPELSNVQLNTNTPSLNLGGKQVVNSSPEISNSPTTDNSQADTSGESTIANIPKFAAILEKAKENPVAQKIDTYFNQKYGRDVADKMVAIAEMEGGWKDSASVANSGEQSFGTFQINLNAHNEKVAKYTGTKDKTVNTKWLSNTDNSIKIADEIYNESGFSPWTTAKKAVKTYQGVLGNGIADFDSLKPTGKTKSNITTNNLDLSGLKIKDQVEWGAKFAEPPTGFLDLIKSPTASGEVNSQTNYRNVPAGTSNFNISQANGKQINFGADFAANKGDELTNPFMVDAKVVKPLGLSGAGNTLRLESILENGQKVYADLNHNDSVKVKIGQTVKPNEVVATAGASGNATGVHSDVSFYTMDKDGKPVYFDTSTKKW